MPISSALAARLARRGINTINSALTTQPVESNDIVEEEVFAQDYDDEENDKDKSVDQNLENSKKRMLSRTSVVNKSSGQDSKGGTSDAKIDKKDKPFSQIEGHLNCPFKTNGHHTCSQHCVTHYTTSVNPSQEYLNAFSKMMERCGPLPEHWRQDFDPGTGRHFFWKDCSGEDDEIVASWLHPKHPLAKIVEPASFVRKRILTSQASKMKSKESKSSKLYDTSSNSTTRDRGGRSNNNRRSNRKEDEIDPMDPSAYSDAPPGSWKRGIGIDNAM